MKFGVVQFPGSNCDYDCYYTVKNVLRVPVDMIWHKDNNLMVTIVLFYQEGLLMGII